MIRIGVLGSTRGTTFNALNYLLIQKKIPAHISCVLSHSKKAGILVKAKTANIDAMYVDSTQHSRKKTEKIMTDILIQYQIDYIVLAGYLNILSSYFIRQWHQKIINVHPSLLPNFAGLMNEAVHQAVLKSGMKTTGCTVHFVTEQLDAGPIILQKKCDVWTHDSVESLKMRVQALEGEALCDAIEYLISKDVKNLS